MELNYKRPWVVFQTRAWKERNRVLCSTFKIKLLDFSTDEESTKQSDPEPLLPEPVLPDDFRCKKCPEWFNDFAIEKKIFVDSESLQVHDLCWHNDKYQHNKCDTCKFRAENLTMMKEFHDRDKEWCKIAFNNQTYIQLE